MIRATVLVISALTVACATRTEPAPAPPSDDGPGGLSDVELLEPKGTHDVIPLPGEPVPFNVSAPTTVVDLFMALPQANLHGRMFGDTLYAREALLRTVDEDPHPAVYRPHRTALDLPNGYLEFFQDGDGDSDRVALTYFKLPGGARLLAQAHTGGPMCGEVSSVWFTRLKDGVWTDVSAEVWPTIPWSAFVDGDTSDLTGTPDVQVVLPRKGTEVRVLFSDCALTDALEAHPDRISRRELRFHLKDGRFTR